MTTAATTPTIQPDPDTEAFPKPGPGTWELDSGHFGANSSKICQDLITIGCTEGSAEGFALMGAPLKELQARFVRGRFYMRQVPLVGGGLGLPLPPAPILRLATRLHPAFRKAEKAAGRAIADKVFLAEHRRWNEEWKPELNRRCRAIAAVEPAELDDTALADHLIDAYELALFGTRLHFRLHSSDLGPIGLLLVRAQEWGLDTGEVMMTFSGHSPATNAPGEALANIRRLARSTNNGQDGNIHPFASLDEIRAASPEAATALDAFINEFGWRLTTGYDIRSQALAEMPTAILTMVNATDEDLAASGATTDAGEVGAAALDSIRRQVDPADHDELEEMVSAARALYGLRDENGPLTYEWPAGLVRRAVLEAGRRLEARGKLPDSDVDQAAERDTNDTVFDLSAEEIASLLRGGTSPNLAQITQRARLRRDGLSLVAPPRLGPDEGEPPVDALPPHLSQLMKAILLVIDLLEYEADPSAAGGAGSSGWQNGSGSTESVNLAGLNGVGIGDEPYVGRACVVTEASEAIAQLEPGDILVAPYTVPTFNSVLAIAGAVVTDAGGLLCHAAVIAREYGIPAVVGAASATTTIPHGATISVDPVTATITIIDAPTLAA